MKAGVIGLGDIARKAYLPVVTTLNLELVLCSRNEEAVKNLARQYRIDEYCYDYRELLKFRVDMVFVHSATKSHYNIVKYFLEAGVHVYVDHKTAVTDNGLKSAEVYKIRIPADIPEAFSAR